MLDNVLGENLIDAVFFDGVGVEIKVVDNIRLALRIDIDPNAVRNFVAGASDI